MTDQEKIERLTKTLGTLISWLSREIGVEAATELLIMLKGEEEVSHDRD